MRRAVYFSFSPTVTVNGKFSCGTFSAVTVYFHSPGWASGPSTVKPDVPVFSTCSPLGAVISIFNRAPLSANPRANWTGPAFLLW